MKFRMLLAFVVLTTVTLSAQTFRGTILGTVTDPSGAVVSGAKVTVRNTGTGLERTAQTSADGSYSIPELPIGTYSVTVSQAGFQTSVTTNVAVDVATERRVDVTLKTGEVSTRVEVSGEFLPQVDWALCQHHFARRPNASSQQVSTMRRPIAPADHGVGMNLGLTILRGNVADQRKQLDLLIQRYARFVLLRFPVEPCEPHGRKCAHGLEACRSKLLF